jgi:hypothetical protein
MSGNLPVHGIFQRPLGRFRDAVCIPCRRSVRPKTVTVVAGNWKIDFRGIRSERGPVSCLHTAPDRLNAVSRELLCEHFGMHLLSCK